MIHFLRFHNRPSCPLEASYRKWILTLIKPWVNDIDESIANNGIYTTTLREFMYNSKHFPEMTKAEILRVKRKKKGVDLEEGAHLFVGN